MEFVPSCEATWNAEALTGKEPTSFRTNSIGLRDAELKDDGAVRILALGDSCTWGWQVPQDDAYPQQLQRLLNEQFGRGQYRVINAGIPGYTSYQGLLYLRDVGIELHPAIVIIAYGFNDASRAPDIVTALARQRTFLPLIHVDDALLAHSQLWRWLHARFGSAPSPRISASGVTGAVAWAQPEQVVRVSPAHFKDNLTSMVEVVRSHGAYPLLVSFAGRPRPEQAYADAIGAVAAEFDVPIVVYDGPRIDRIHPSREGYAALAAVILARLETVGVIPNVTNLPR
jgi:lysophospholipase L1-like esterase